MSRILFISFLLIHFWFLGQNDDLDSVVNINPYKNINFIEKSSQLYSIRKLDTTQSDIQADSIFYVNSNYIAIVDTSKKFPISLYDENLNEIVSSITDIKSSKNIITWRESKGFRVYDGALKSSLYDSILLTDQYGLLFKNKKQSIFNTNQKVSEFENPKYDFCGPYYDGILVSENKKLGWKGTYTSIPIQFDHIYKVRKNIFAAKNSSGITYFFSDIDQKLNADPKDSVVFYDKHYKVVSGSKQTIYDYRNVFQAQINNYEIHPFYKYKNAHATKYFIVSNGEKCALYFDNALQTDFLFDNFIPQNFIHDEYFIIEAKNQGVGLIDKTGKIILNTIYENINDVYKDYFLVENNNKFGVVTHNDTVILASKYIYIVFNQNYAVFSQNSQLDYGLFNLSKRQFVTAEKYNHISVKNNFIVGTYKDNSADLFYKDSVKLTRMLNVSINDKIFKGYKNNFTYIAYISENDWELTKYEIPIMKKYKEKNDSEKSRKIPFYNSAAAVTYDYVKGKWGIYHYNQKKWIIEPKTHSGDILYQNRLLNYYSDTISEWNGIHFNLTKSFSDINSKDLFYWIDNNNLNFTEKKTKDGIFSSNLKGIIYNNIENGQIYESINKINPYHTNYATNLSNLTDVISTEGKLTIAKDGDILLSQFISQISEYGGTHPYRIEDYKTITSINNRIKSDGQTEYFVSNATFSNEADWLKITTPYDWIDKNKSTEFIVRRNGKYGVINEQNNYILDILYDTIYREKNRFIVGTVKDNYKIFNPETQEFIGTFKNIIDFKDSLLVIENEIGIIEIYNEKLVKIYQSEKNITLLGESDFVENSSNYSKLYRNGELMFEHNSPNSLRLNYNLFLTTSPSQKIFFNENGDTILVEKSIANYELTKDLLLISDKTSKRLYNHKGKLIEEFESKKYQIINDSCLIYEENDHVIICSDYKSPTKLKGRLIETSKYYIVIKNNKYFEVYDWKGKNIASKLDYAWSSGLPFFTYKKDKKYFLFNIEKNTKTSIISYHVESFSNKTYTDKNKEKHTIFFEIENEKQKISSPFEIVSKNYRQGISKTISESQQENILPLDNFIIIPFSKYFLVQDELEYIVYDINSEKFLTQNYFDTITPYLIIFQGIRDKKIYYFDELGIISLTQK